VSKVRVKFLKPHGDHQHCTYAVMTAGQANKLEGKGIVQIRGAVADDYVEPVRPDVALGQEG
jgi:hypothetical protein